MCVIEIELILTGYCLLDPRSTIDQTSVVNARDNVRSGLEWCLFVQACAEAAMANDVITYSSTPCHPSLPWWTMRSCITWCFHYIPDAPLQAAAESKLLQSLSFFKVGSWSITWFPLNLPDSSFVPIIDVANNIQGWSYTWKRVHLDGTGSAVGTKDIHVNIQS